MHCLHIIATMESVFARGLELGDRRR